MYNILKKVLTKFEILLINLMLTKSHNHISKFQFPDLFFFFFCFYSRNNQIHFLRRNKLKNNLFAILWLFLIEM